MIDWEKYPVVRFALMLTTGIFVSSLFCQQEIITPARSIIVCCLLLLGLLLSHLAINAGDTSREGARINRIGFLLFGVNTMLFAFVFGFIIGTHSIRHAYNSYGSGWRYELYKHNKLQNPIAARVQSKASAYFEQNAFAGSESGVVRAMTLGDKTALSKDMKRHFSRAGVSHVLAVSGYHLTLVYSIFILPFIILANYSFKRYLSVLSCFVLFAYAMFTGMPPSMTRAIIMYCIATMLSLKDEVHISLNNCVSAALIMLLIEPIQLFHIGFQLSFAAIIGICVVMGRISKVNIPIRNGLVRYCITFVVATTLLSIVCNVFTLPLVVYHFHQIPLLSLFSNIAVSILVPLVMFLTVMWWAFCWCAPVAMLIAQLLFVVTHTMIVVVEWISALPYSVLYVG